MTFSFLAVGLTAIIFFSSVHCRRLFFDNDDDVTRDHHSVVLIWNYQLNLHQGWDVYNKENEERVWKEKYAEYVERPKSKCSGVLPKTRKKKKKK